MENRLVAKDYRLFVFCAAIAAVSLFIISRFFYQAFPEASIDFKVTRNQSRPIAEKYLDDLGYDIGAYRHSAIFSYDENAKTFLEKELGAEKANELMGGKIRLWRWANRWYKPLEKEEFLVHVSPGGDITGFRHQIAEEQQGAVLSADSARTIARDFLFRNLALNSQHLEFVEESSQERPNRMDFSFTWKEKDFEVMEATYRYRVDIYGDQIGALEQFLHVPEKWSRDYEKLRAKNETTGMVSGFFLFLTLFAIIVMGVIYARHRDIRWKTAAIYGIIAAVLTFLSLINRLPLTQFNYPTTESYQSFILRQVLVNLVNAILAGTAIFLLTAAAEPIYREKYPRFVSLSNLFRWQSIRSKKFFVGVIVGLTMTFFFAAYQVTFYLLSNRFGAWAPQQIPYDNMLNTTFPWIYVLLIGFMPAVSEEFISRLFSIPFFHKIVRVRWLAVVIPAFIWGFAHSNYPQQPFYIRGLEVGIAGIIIGYVMLRFGILAPLIWHYTVDALYTALVFLRSGNWYFISTAAISCGIMLLPLVIALVAYLRHRTFAVDDNLRNSAEGFNREYSPVKAPENQPLPQYSPLSTGRIITGFAIAALLFSAIFIKTDKLGDFVEFSHLGNEAKKAADEFLKGQQVDIADYKTVTYTSERIDPLVSKYTLEHAGIKRLNRLYASESKANRWGIRYFKPLQKEEYLVNIDPVDLSLVSYARTVEETAEGAFLEQDSARAVAADFTRKQGIDVSRMAIKKATSENRENRRDHEFEWEAGDGDSRNVGDMKFRVVVSIQGDRLGMFTTYSKIPEKWQRERKKRTIINTALLGLKLALVLVLVILTIIRFIRQAKVGNVMWKPTILVAGVASVLFLLDRLLQINLTMQNYPTSIDSNLFHITVVTAMCIAALAVFLGVGMATGLLSALYPHAVSILKKPYRRLYARDASVAALVALLGFTGIRHLQHILASFFPKFTFLSTLAVPTNIQSPIPLFSETISALLIVLLLAAFIGILLFVLKDTFKKPALVFLFGLGIFIAFLPIGVRSAGEALLMSGRLLLLFIWVLFVLNCMARNNLAAYGIIPLVLTVASTATFYLQQNNRFLFANGFGFVILALLSLIWYIMPWLLKTKEDHNDRSEDVLSRIG